MGQSPPTIGSETHTRGDLLRGGAGNVRTYAIVPSIGLAERLRREGHVGRVKRDDRLDVERLPCLGPGARPAGSGGADVRHAGDGATRMSSRDISVESRPRRLLGAVWPIDRWCPRSGCAGVGRCRVSIADGSTELRQAGGPVHFRRCIDAGTPEPPSRAVSPTYRRLVHRKAPLVRNPRSRVADIAVKPCRSRASGAVAADVSPWRRDLSVRRPRRPR
jgi:hypothetical protein